MAGGTPVHPPAPLPTGREWEWRPDYVPQWRVYHRDDRCPNPRFRRVHGPHGRFDHHRPDGSGAAQFDPDERSVVYVGADPVTCLLEAFGLPGKKVPELIPLCDRWYLASVGVNEACRLTDLLAGGCLAVGADQALATGDVDRPTSQAWARAFYDEYSTRVGVRYSASHLERECVAAWDRAPELTVFGDRQIRRGVWRNVFTALADLNVAANKIDAIQCTTCLDHGVIDPADFVPLP